MGLVLTLQNFTRPAKKEFPFLGLMPGIDQENRKHCRKIKKFDRNFQNARSFCLNRSRLPAHKNLPGTPRLGKSSHDRPERLMDVRKSTLRTSKGMT